MAARELLGNHAGFGKAGRAAGDRQDVRDREVRNLHAVKLVRTASKRQISSFSE